MSADLLRSRVTAALTAERTHSLQRLRLCKPRATIVQQASNSEGVSAMAVTPPSTAEEIALFAVDINATVDAYDKALAIINTEFDKITKPEQSAEEAKDTGKEKNFYGG